jgi:4-hydroxy-tetrahydrodipicolinate synthase
MNADHRLDLGSVPRLVEHHLKLGVSGLMLAGTCGEGPWLHHDDKPALIRAAVTAAAGRLRVAVQVTDNSSIRVLANIEQAAAAGAQIAVVDAPHFFLNATPERKLAHYLEIARHSPLPLGFYDRGKASANALPETHLRAILDQPAVIMVKDSSGDNARREHYLEAKRRRPELVILDGDEFNCASYLQAGYDGLLLGGGIFNGAIAARIIAAVSAGNLAEAERLQARMNDLMLRVYGGPKIECWMSGLKELLVQMKLFSTSANLLGYPLTESCRDRIRAIVDGTDGRGYREDVFGLPAR